MTKMHAKNRTGSFGGHLASKAQDEDFVIFDIPLDSPSEHDNLRPVRFG